SRDEPSEPGMTGTATITTPDGLHLHARLWSRHGTRGLLIVSHGLGEHSGCYAGFAEQLGAQAAPGDLLAFDYRGHGRSPGRRGVVRRYEDFGTDLRTVLAWARKKRGDQPFFLLGHSNGGQVA